MILTGTNYNIANPSEEIKRMRGAGLYNESRLEHFSNLHKRTTGAGLYSKDNIPDNFSKLEYIERVKSKEPRKRINNMTLKNSGRAISGRSTAGIRAQRKREPLIDAKIILANTKREEKLNQDILPN